MRILLTSIFLFGFVFSSNAALTRTGTIITDDVSGFDWLALTETTGEAYADVLTTRTDWSYATQADIAGMFDSLFPGVTYGADGTFQESTSTSSLYDDFAFFFGKTGGTESMPHSLGMFADASDTIQYAGVTRNKGVTDTLRGTGALASAFPLGMGTFLVKKPAGTTPPPAGVPEAASLYLLAFGLFGLIAARRKV